MSEPEIEWYVQRIKVMLGEIDTLVLGNRDGWLTNSIREIISHNTNEIEIDLHIIIRKLRDEARKAPSTNKTG